MVADAVDAKEGPASDTVVEAERTSSAGRSRRVPRLRGQWLASVFGSWSGRIGLALIVLFLVVCFVPLFIAGNPLAENASPLLAPSGGHWFGTDQLGRDILARTSAGARLSLEVAIGSVVLGLAVALPLGMVAGYYARTWLDEVIMRAFDVVLALPLFVLGILILGLTGEGPTIVFGVSISVTWKVIIIISVSTLPQFARVARGATIVEREEDYVAALRVLGVSRFRIIATEISLNVLPPVLVQAFLWMAVAIFAEAALSFLGLGVQAPNPTLGNLLQNAEAYVLLGAWWYSVFPGLVLFVVILGLNLVGDGLNDWLDSGSS